jgi:MSHA biogenesis protein MshK
MAESMSARILLMALAASLAWLPAVWAQQLRDPTQPPNLLMQDGAAAGTAGEPVLQSVFISSTRRAAIINGQNVKLGEKFNGSTLVKITESEAVLRNGSELQTLKLFPGIGKRLTSVHGRQNPDNRK